MASRAGAHIWMARLVLAGDLSRLKDRRDALVKVIEAIQHIMIFLGIPQTDRATKARAVLADKRERVRKFRAAGYVDVTTKNVAEFERRQRSTTRTVASERATKARSRSRRKLVIKASQQILKMAEQKVETTIPAEISQPKAEESAVPAEASCPPADNPLISWLGAGNLPAAEG